MPENNTQTRVTTYARARAHKRRLSHSLRGRKGERKKERGEKKKSIAGDSGARRRIVSCQNNILPSSPPDRCGGLGTEGSLSPLLSLRFFLLGVWCSLIFTSVKERPRRLSALIDSDTWGSVLRLRMSTGPAENGKGEMKGMCVKEVKGEGSRRMTMANSGNVISAHDVYIYLNGEWRCILVIKINSRNWSP